MTRPEQSKPVAGSAPPQTYGTPRKRSAIETARTPIGPAGGAPANSGPSKSTSACPGDPVNPSVAQPSTAPERAGRAAGCSVAGRPTRRSVTAGRPKDASPMCTRIPTRPTLRVFEPGTTAVWSTTR